MTTSLKRKRLIAKLESISPEWASVLKAPNIKEEERLLSKYCLDIGNPCRCIVGEAHGFNTDYRPQYDIDCTLVKGCTICDVLSCEMLGVMIYNIAYPVVHGWTAVETFIEHFNKEHAKK